MARYTESVCRLCRREGIKLFLKGSRCYTDKCAIERREYAPGQHGQARQKLSDYGLQLREKQKVRRFYSVLERQFERYFEMASRRKGITGEYLLQLLERRLDNSTYRLGFASSRSEARQMVLHGHILVNGKRASIPSMLMRTGDVVEVRPKSQEQQRIAEALKMVEQRGVPAWLELDSAHFKGVVKALPARSDVTFPIEEQLVVELYSK